MRLLEKIVLVLDRAEDMAVLLLCMALFLGGLYGLYDSILVYQDADNTGILKYRPGDEAGTDTDKQIEGNMVAWLTLDDTTVDYPVMQGTSNTEYLTKDPFGEYSLSGSIFLDCRNNADFSDGYSLIYGHHMERGLMFGALDAFLDGDYFDSHKTGTLTVGEEIYTIRIFAVAETGAANKVFFSPAETERRELMNYIETQAVCLDENITVGEGEPVIGLSTCKYPDTVQRTIVLGKLEK